MRKRLNKLTSLVEELYVKSKRFFARWGYEHHLKIVAKWAEKIAKDKKANSELVICAVYLHDIADVWLENRPENHEQESRKKGRELLIQSGYRDEEIDFILDKIIPLHACDSKLPDLLEAKILATADALAHFDSDFYLGFVWYHFNAHNLEEFKPWLLKKIDKDFNIKIFWPEYRKIVKDRFRALKLIFA